MTVPRSTVLRGVSSALVMRFLVPPVALVSHASLALPANAAVILSNGAEELRKAASFIPGYGPPDILFPAAFRGRWTVSSKVVDIKTPLGEEVAPTTVLLTTRQLLSTGSPLTLDARYLSTDGGSSGVVLSTRDSGLSTSPLETSAIIADRAFNAEHRAAAQPGVRAV